MFESQSTNYEGVKIFTNLPPKPLPMQSGCIRLEPTVCLCVWILPNVPVLKIVGRAVVYNQSVGGIFLFLSYNNIPLTVFTSVGQAKL
jgi:hypothetical protein